MISFYLVLILINNILLMKNFSNSNNNFLITSQPTLITITKIIKTHTRIPFSSSSFNRNNKALLWTSSIHNKISSKRKIILKTLIIIILKINMLIMISININIILRTKINSSNNKTLVSTIKINVFKINNSPSSFLTRCNKIKIYSSFIIILFSRLWIEIIKTRVSSQPKWIIFNTHQLLSIMMIKIKIKKINHQSLNWKNMVPI